MNNADKELVLYEVPEKFLQTILDYLAQKPYKEVHGLVRLIQSLRPLQVPAAELAKAKGNAEEAPVQPN